MKTFSLILSFGFYLNKSFLNTIVFYWKQIFKKFFENGTSSVEIVNKTSILFAIYSSSKMAENIRKSISCLANLNKFEWPKNRIDLNKVRCKTWKGIILKQLQNDKKRRRQKQSMQIAGSFRYLQKVRPAFEFDPRSVASISGTTFFFHNWNKSNKVDKQEFHKIQAKWTGGSNEL